MYRFDFIKQNLYSFIAIAKIYFSLMHVYKQKYMNKNKMYNIQN